MRLMIYYVFSALLIFNTVKLSANQNNETDIKEHLGTKLPLNLVFKDENGNLVELKNVFTKSTVLAFVYYHCPGVCTPLMNEMVNVVNKTDLVPGKDFDIITISIDQNETPADAKQKKENLMKLMKPGFPDSSWLFLTGDSTSISIAAKTAGFNFERTGNTFIHTAALIFISNDGKICRYLYPTYLPDGEFSILPFDFKMANIETSKGSLMPTVGKVLQFCFSYDPKGKTYVVNILQISGALTLIGALIFVLVISFKPKKKTAR